MNMIFKRTLIGVCALAYVTAAGAATSEDTTGSSEDQADQRAKSMVLDLDKIRQPETMVERRELRRLLANRRLKELQRLNQVRKDVSRPVDGEVPAELLNKIIEELVTKQHASRSNIEVLRAESLIWNDGSLGCGKPGELFTQAQVPGYRVILGYAGQQFDYRATEHGLFILCERPALAAPGASKNPPIQ